MRIKPLLILALASLVSASAWAQVQTSPKSLDPTLKKKKRPKRITEEFSFGGGLSSDGWRILGERAVLKGNDLTTFYFFTISEKQHPKETKVLNENFASIFPDQPLPLPYKYGKVNNFYQFKLGYGQKRQITGRLDKKSVIIHWVYAGGLSIGLLKPYHLDVLIPEGNNTFRRELIDYEQEEFQHVFLDETLIVGGGDFSNGLDALSIRPGIVMRSGFYFDYETNYNKETNRKTFAGMEVGASLELYPGNVPLMATVPSRFFFANLYVDARFGRRWAKSRKRR